MYTTLRTTNGKESQGPSENYRWGFAIFFNTVWRPYVIWYLDHINLDHINLANSMKVRNPIIGLICTKKFQVYSFLYEQSINFDITDVFVDLNCEYTKNIVLNALAVRPWCNIVSNIDVESSNRIIQFSDF